MSNDSFGLNFLKNMVRLNVGTYQMEKTVPEFIKT